MNYIILDPQQSASVAQSSGSVEIRNSDGAVIGFLVRKSPSDETPIVDADYEFSAEEIAEARRRLASPGPRLTTQQVLDHLRSLEGQ